jgi:hypothetical protein
MAMSPKMSALNASGITGVVETVCWSKGWDAATQFAAESQKCPPTTHDWDMVPTRPGQRGPGQADW